MTDQTRRSGGHDHLAHLIPERRRAVQALAGPVIAGAGSGKTRLLVARVRHLIDSGAAEDRRVPAVTFTRKAAGAVRVRLAQAIGLESASRVTIGIFQSLGHELLMERPAAAGLRPGFGVDALARDGDPTTSIARARRGPIEAGADPSSVTLMTLHASKGLEAPGVYLADWMAGCSPPARALKRSISSGPNPLEEERRLAYLGITRAMRHLVITWSLLIPRGLAAGPSPFIEEMPSRLVRRESPVGALSRAAPHHRPPAPHCRPKAGSDRPNRRRTRPANNIAPADSPDPPWPTPAALAFAHDILAKLHLAEPRNFARNAARVSEITETHYPRLRERRRKRYRWPPRRASRRMFGGPRCRRRRRRGRPGERQ